MYPAGGISSAIENAFHTTPQLICLKGALEEVRMCFNKDFTVCYFFAYDESLHRLVDTSKLLPQLLSSFHT